jgi:Mrp family chromosome partitioning ATPase
MMKSRWRTRKRARGGQPLLNDGTEVTQVLRRLDEPVANVPGLLARLQTYPFNPAELLGSDKAAEVFQVLAEDFEIVLIDKGRSSGGR